MKRSSRLLCAAAVVAAPAFAAGQAEAQEPPAGMQAEIVVTAQKRVETLQDVPLAVTALSGDMLEARGLTQLDDISRLAPSFRVETGENPNDTRIVMRGIAVGSVELTQSPSVGVYVDGVYQSGRQGLNVDLLDVERIEVLRGPQGTLFGRNTAAGALNIVTRPPSKETQGRLSVEAGNFDYYKLSGGVSAPLGESGFSARVAATMAQREGYVDNAATGDKLAGFELGAARASLAYDSRGPFTFDLAFDVSKDQVKSNPNVANWRDRRVAFNSPHEVDREVAGAVLHTDYDFGAVALSSITGYRYWRDQRYDDLDDTTASTAFSLNEVTSRSLSQELRLADASGGAFDWLFGLYAISEDIKSATDLTLTLPSPPPAGPTQFRGVGRPHFEDQSYAAFGQATYAFSDQFKLTLGARYTQDQRDQSQIVTGFIPNVLGQPSGAPLASSASTDYGVATGKIALAWEPSPTHTFYALVAQGYRAGGSNVSSAAPQREYDPEESLNYEIGYKTQAFDRRLRFAGAAYFIDYQKLQVFLTDPVTQISYTTNSEAAESYGVEAELNAVLTERLSAALTLGWTHARYKDFAVCDFSPPTDCGGKKMQYAPDWTGAARLDYERPLKDGLTLLAGLDVSYSGELYFTPANLPESRRDPLWLTNGELGLRFADDTATISLWGRNLFDEEYFTAFTEAGLSPTPTYALGLPRTWGVRVSKTF